jgi:O-antigen ligase
LAANLIPPIFPILLLLRAERDPTANNIYFLTLLIIVNLFAVYLSGNRISWLIITIFLIAIIFQYKGSLLPKIKSYILLVTISFVFYIYSQPVQGRYISTFKALTGQIDTRYDSSGAKRLKWAQIAIKSVVSDPLGTGWANQGWVHSDILQVAASIGIIPGIIFILAPIILLLRIYRMYLTCHSEQKTLLFVFCCLMIFIIISLSLNGNFFLVQCGVPLFLFWALAFSYSEHHNNIGHGYSL